MKRSEFVKMVEDAETNKEYTLPETFRYAWFKIDEKNAEFSWTLKMNYNVSKSSGYVFPEGSGGYVKYFKTISGAKRNLINRFDENTRFNPNFWDKE